MNIGMTDEFYMQLALNKAWEYQGLTYPNPTVGAVVVQDGKILAVAAHQKAGTSHAEVLALTRAYEVLESSNIDFDPTDAQKAHAFLRSLPKDFFSKCTIYVTLEPCSHKGKTPSCASLLASLNLEKVVIGTRDTIEEHSGGMEIVGRGVLTPTIVIGVLEKECKSLIEPFMIWQKRAFVLFKIAQTSNGRIGGGYLSSKESLKHVHQLREDCDILCIGGNTVRVDRPTLDCRFTEGRAPNVVIYTKEDNFDREIPLFSVSNRKVEVTQNLDFLDKPSFVMVEGGEGMLEAFKEKIDWMLVYQTPKLSSNTLTYNTTMNLAFLHQSKKDVDLMIWSKKIGH
ncbi:MAG: bifunctional diaminohydroxyphosphoribosylaminopyrimidine deaminase/5-amino-6-(5-phosphoribosylamino)uracil reductase RibD [Campylobacterota bacterium]|nr:bifunctional diaminohydroxyphosphoribosylaminopyrimidine deaminase/5-amino-6-(5-phosphoribosylamino)uracil reductase RibD [Campylobacterota bacterium]